MNTAQSHFSDVAWLLDRFPQSRRVFTSTSRAVQAQMCQRGMGIAVLPRPLGDAITGLAAISMPEPPPSKDIWVGYHSDLRHMDRLRVMLDIADAMLADPAARQRERRFTQPLSVHLKAFPVERNQPVYKNPDTGRQLSVLWIDSRKLHGRAFPVT